MELGDKNILEAPEGVFDTHKFFYTLNYEGQIKGHKVTFINRNGKEQIIELDNIDIGTSPVSCKLYDLDGKRHIVPFFKIKFVHKNNELVWDNSDVNLSNIKTIKGYKK